MKSGPRPTGPLGPGVVIPLFLLVLFLTYALIVTATDSPPPSVPDRLIPLFVEESRTLAPRRIPRERARHPRAAPENSQGRSRPDTPAARGEGFLQSKIRDMAIHAGGILDPTVMEPQ